MIETHFPIPPSSKGMVMCLGSANEKHLYGTWIQESLQESGTALNPLNKACLCKHLASSGRGCICSRVAGSAGIVLRSGQGVLWSSAQGHLGIVSGSRASEYPLVNLFSV